MITRVTRPPGIRRLVRGLDVLAQRNGTGSLPIRVISRRRTNIGGSFATEVVTCRLDGRELRLFCKYGLCESAHRAKSDHASHGHRGGVAREARVYRELLEPLGMPHARLFGAYHEGATRQVWLILEHLESALRPSELPMSALEPAMTAAARWIGRFHRTAASWASALSEVGVYDAGYYRGWAERTLRFAGAWRRYQPGLEMVCERFDSVAAELAALPHTVIHGEYYPHNLLVHEGQVYPVDWESAAVAAGQIDLAALTEQWPNAVVRRCEAAYRRARWPDGAPSDFRRGLDAARLYLSFRWLGDRPAWTRHPDARIYFEQIQALAIRLGLIGREDSS